MSLARRVALGALAAALPLCAPMALLAHAVLQAARPELRLAPDRGPVGSTVLASGSGHLGCDDGLALWVAPSWQGDRELAGVKLDHDRRREAGAFTVSFLVPGDAQPGTYRVRSGCWGQAERTGALLATAAFTVTQPEPPTGTTVSPTSTTVAPTSTTPPPTTTTVAQTSTTVAQTSTTAPPTSTTAPTSTTRVLTSRTVDPTSTTVAPGSGRPATSTRTGAPGTAGPGAGQPGRPARQVGRPGRPAARPGRQVGRPVSPGRPVGRPGRASHRPGDIRGWLLCLRRRLGAWRRARPRRRLSPAAQLALFTVLGALLLTTVEPSAGANRAGLALALGFLVALPLTTLTYAATIEASYRQLSSRWSSLQVLPPALAVALACALLSRVAHFEPGYVYGLFAGYAAVSRPALSRVDKGRGIVLACLFTLSASLAAWVAREWLRQQWPPGAHGFGLLVADNLLTAVFVAGVEGVVFSLIPLRFMHGFTLARWSLPAWASLCLVGMFGLVHVLLDPKAPQGGDAGPAPLVSALVLFIAFGVFSLAFWAWFRWRRLSP